MDPRNGRAPYFNKIMLQGKVTSRPKIVSMNERTKLTAFQLTTIESWVNGGQRKERKNRVQVEVVGRDAERVHGEARFGSWVTLEGYLRSETFKGQDLIKVRTFKIEVWEDEEQPARG